MLTNLRRVLNSTGGRLPSRRPLTDPKTRSRSHAQDSPSGVVTSGPSPTNDANLRPRGTSPAFAMRGPPVTRPSIPRYESFAVRAPDRWNYEPTKSFSVVNVNADPSTSQLKWRWEIRMKSQMNGQDLPFAKTFQSYDNSVDRNRYTLCQFTGPNEREWDMKWGAKHGLLPHLAPQVCWAPTHPKNWIRVDTFIKKSKDRYWNRVPFTKPGWYDVTLRSPPGLNCRLVPNVAGDKLEFHVETASGQFQPMIWAAAQAIEEYGEKIPVLKVDKKVAQDAGIQEEGLLDSMGVFLVAVIYIVVATRAMAGSAHWYDCYSAAFGPDDSAWSGS